MSILVQKICILLVSNIKSLCTIFVTMPGLKNDIIKTITVLDFMIHAKRSWLWGQLRSARKSGECLICILISMLMNCCIHLHFIFVISIPMLDVTVVWKGQRSLLWNYSLAFKFNAGHMKHSYRNHKYKWRSSVALKWGII